MSLARGLLWRRLDIPGLEHFRLIESPGGPRLEGTVLLPHEGLPVHAKYEITCSPDWQTRRVVVTCTHGRETRHLEMTVSQGRWRRADGEVGTVSGCVDVDLAVTPSTNTLPIRRLDLAVGEGRDVIAAWVRFPGLTVEPLPQRYVRMAAQLYRYESRGGEFTAELEVDAMGVVVRYGSFWERVAVVA
jgi:uncharacterized protein